MLPSIAQHANQHGIKPLKKYGQNFIFDASLCDKIVRHSCVPERARVLEIGPGTGGLTRSILAIKPSTLTVIETDKRCLPLLEEIAEDLVVDGGRGQAKSDRSNLELMNADALSFDITKIASEQDKIYIISNLPYNIGTELIIRWLETPNIIESMTLMLQKEVVERITSNPNTKSYGRLSIICQLLCKVHKCFDVSSKAFYPAPKVQSAIVQLVPYSNQYDRKLINKLEYITRLAFSQRRKMIKSSLKAVSLQKDLKGSDLISILNRLNINPESRAEALSPKEYLEIAKLVLEAENSNT